jgi:HAD superfamily hydrolase (TIGR01490 family)
METNRRLVVAFDFDGTLTRKDTFLEFIRFVKGKRAFFTGFLLYCPLLILCLLKIYPRWKAKQKLFGYFFSGMPVTEFAGYGEKFCSTINGILRPGVLETIADYRQKNAAIYIVSASVDYWISPWCRSAGIECIATKVEADAQGLLTGKFLTKNCYGQEKVNRLTEKEPARATYILHAYGDSRGDKQLIEYADKGWYNKF